MYEESSYLSSRDDLFKKKFKYFKSNMPKPFRDILSVDDYVDIDKVRPTLSCLEEDQRTELLGLHKLHEWKTYKFLDHPGLILIRNPFTTAGQRYWIRQCLEIYPRKPNKTNIDIEMCCQDWWSECFKTSNCNRPLQKKLRWTTFGYHHNWDTKVYSENNKSNFPEELAELSDILAEYLGCKSFKAQAAIVNYYHMDSTLSAHTDHSEVNLEAPLFSVSFGQSAIFLIGGQDKSTEPTAILLKSGDILVMSQESRLCYHAVPKILPAIAKPWNDQDHHIAKTCDSNNLKYLINQIDVAYKVNKNLDDSEWSAFSSYIEECRINMNVRQVLNEKQHIL